MRSSEFDRFADEYESMHAENISITGERPEYFHAYKIEALQRLVRQNNIHADRILDFGSGIGNSTPFLHAHFPNARLNSADVSSRSLQIAEGRFPGISAALPITGQTIPSDDNSFGIVFSACVFHHSPHEEHVLWLRELHRVTRPGGIIAVFEHNPLNPLTVRAVNTCPFDENARLIPAGQLMQSYRSSGWQRIRTTYHVFFPRSLSWLRPIEPSLKHLPIGGQYLVTAVKL
jgi:ubiquinone/menaquinone biosynthesis C-methylase UbiE